MCEIECFLIDETRTRMSQAWWGGKAEPRQAAAGAAHGS